MQHDTEQVHNKTAIDFESPNFIHGIFRKRPEPSVSSTESKAKKPIFLNPGRIIQEQKAELLYLENIESQLCESPDLTMRILALMCLKEGDIEKAEEFFQSALDINSKVFCDIGVEKTSDYTPNIQALIKALRALNVPINPIMPVEIIFHIGKLSDHKTFLNMARCSKKLSELVGLNIKNRFFTYVRAGGIEEVKQALEKMSAAAMRNMLTCSLVLKWEDKDGHFTEYSDTALQLAWRTQDYLMYGLIKSRLDSNDCIIQMSAFKGAQFDCIAEIESAYFPLVKNLNLPDMSNEAIINIDKLAYALYRCWKNNAFAIHRFCNEHSGWNEKNVERLFARNLAYVQSWVRSAIAHYEKIIKVEAESCRLSREGKGLLIWRNNSQVDNVPHRSLTLTRNGTQIQTVRFMHFNDHDRECFANLRGSLNKTRAKILDDEMKEAKEGQKLQNTMRSLSLQALKNGDIETAITYIKSALALNEKIYDHGMIVYVNFTRQPAQTIDELKQILPFVRFVSTESAEEKSASSLGF